MEGVPTANAAVSFDRCHRLFPARRANSVSDSVGVEGCRLTHKRSTPSALSYHVRSSLSEPGEGKPDAELASTVRQGRCLAQRIVFNCSLKTEVRLATLPHEDYALEIEVFRAACLHSGEGAAFFPLLRSRNTNCSLLTQPLR